MDGCWHDSCSTRHQSITHPRAGLDYLILLAGRYPILCHPILSSPIQSNAFQAGLSLHPVKSVPFKDCSTVHPSLHVCRSACSISEDPQPGPASPCLALLYFYLPCLALFVLFPSLPLLLLLFPFFCSSSRLSYLEPRSHVQLHSASCHQHLIPLLI